MDASYLPFSGQVPNYAFGAMLPQDANLPLQNFERTQQPDLSGRMSNVMLAYEAAAGASMPMNLDPTTAFAYETPPYPATTMGIQFQSTYPPFQQSMPAFTEPPPRREQYETTTETTANFEDSDVSGRNSDRSQVPTRAPRRLERPLGHTRPSQPVAIQPKKPPPVIGEYPSRYARNYPLRRLTRSKRTSHLGWKSPKLAQTNIRVSTRAVASMCWGRW